MTPDPGKMADVAAAQTTVSDKIRALDAAGYARAEIARFLGKRYQQVRNVLVDDSQREGGGYVLGRADLSGVREAPPAAFDREGDDKAFVQARGGGAYRLVVRPDGSILLPKEVVEAFSLEPGHPVMAKLDGDTFKLISAETAMRQIREMVQRIVPRGVSLADELIAERRADAAREEADD
jgi:hypothetical protein